MKKVSPGATLSKPSGKIEVQAEAVRMLPESCSLKYKIMPVAIQDEALVIACAAPIASDSLAEITKAAGVEVRCLYLSEEEIANMRSKVYGRDVELDKIFNALEVVPDVGLSKAEQQKSVVDDIFAQGPVSKAIHILIEEAVRQGASDIHLEPQESNYRIRFRIDGILKEMRILKKSLQPSLTSSTKIMAALDIGEQRMPQDGRFHLTTLGRNIDLRVSSFPTMYGEKIVMRILDKEQGVLSLEGIGFTGSELVKLERLIQRPHGIVLVTGPTGSGKSTTLYAILTKISNFTRNVITLEDPIEYNLPGVNQAQINPKKGLTFATGLRAILRQDPDIVMVGEIRDGETAEIAIHASLTGHLVLSTLHTNDAPSAITRLIDMGVEPFLAASSIEGVMGQRLLRRLCKLCRKEFNPPTVLLEKLGLAKKDITGKFYEANGCAECSDTGYRGRLAIIELMLIDEPIRELISKKASASEIRKVAIKGGMKTLREDAIEKVQQGDTSIEELLRILSEVASYESE